jgi:hypothetical protein
LTRALEDALKKASKPSAKKHFHFSYSAPDANDIDIDVVNGHIFSNTSSHLFVRRETTNSLRFDIYAHSGDTLIKVASHDQWHLTYTSDTIMDINGDGLKDFVVNWYGSNGCCLKGFTDIYLLRPDRHTFTEMFEFINPTFSLKEGVIRGIGYGHAGETNMYKYKGNDDLVDTLEFVEYQKDDNGKKTGKVLVTSGNSSSANFRKSKVLDDVPKEYRTIDYYYWFSLDDSN